MLGRANLRLSDWVMQQDVFKGKRGAIEALVLTVEIVTLLVSMTIACFQSFLSLFLPPKEKSLASDIILVTGSGHGIGRELVLQLASEGSTVVGWDLSEEGNAETYKLLKERGLERKAKFYVCDVSSREEVLRTAEKVEAEVGDVTILINNAGIMKCRPLNMQSHEDVVKVFEVNVLSQFWALEAFLPQMKAKNSGHIVSTCSLCGVIGIANAVPYCSTKFAVRGLMETLYEELRLNPDTRNIKMTTVYPITVQTGLAKRPRHRFPSLFQILEPDYVASEMIRAIKRESYELALPGFMLNFDRVTRLMPKKMIEMVKDFLDTGVDPE